MASVAETIGYGATVEINDGGAGSYAQVFNIIDFDPPAEKLNFAESKRLDTPSAVIVSVPTMFDPGDCTMHLQTTDVGFSRLEGLRRAKTKCNFRFTIPVETGTKVRIVPGYIMQNKQDPVKPDEIETFACSIKIVGPES